MAQGMLRCNTNVEDTRRDRIILRNMEPKLDLRWNDDGVVPAKVSPDLEFLFRQGERLILEAVAAREGEYILDVGCGRAIDAALLGESGAVVVGLEPSEVMLSRAKEHLGAVNALVALSRGVGESLPFRSNSFDKVICKGALDHFLSPDKTMKEISRVLKLGGEVIIAIANLESLACQIGRGMFRLRAIFSPETDDAVKPWEPPPDHTFKFDYQSISSLVKSYFQVKEAKGISLLYGIPGWGKSLSSLPRPVRHGILVLLDKAARPVPSLADVILMKCALFSRRK